MKKISAITLLLLIFSAVFAQEKTIPRIPLLGDPAPKFTAESTNGTITFPADYFGKWKILFSHPADFTAVCSSELLVLADMQKDFTDLNTAVIVVSSDSRNSHIEWVKSLESITLSGKDPVKIQFPLISDEKHEIANMYGMIQPATGSTKNVRAVFIINPENEIGAIFYYPSTVGRNMEEIKRTLIALQATAKHDILTPANWEPGKDVLLPSPASINDSRVLEAKKDARLYSPVWYMWYKKQK